MADIKVKNVYYMLSYAFQTLQEEGIRNVDSEDFDNIHDLFAQILILGVGAQVKRGLHRDYIQKQEALAGLRGQIDVSETIKQQTMPQYRLICSFDEFSPDSPHNRALKSVLLLLLRHGTVNSERKKAIRKLLLYLNDVSEIEPASIRWDALRYHRNNASYRMLLGICRLTVKGLLQTTEDGTQKLTNWLQAEEMHTLYQKFVFSYYKQRHKDLSPSAPHIKWDIEGDKPSPYLPRMESDICLRFGEKRLIIDTKYYQSGTMQKHFDTPKFISDDLYQIYAYVKNSDKQATGKVAGALLYAKTDEDIFPDEEMKIGRNQISLKTLDLNQEWSKITEQLDKLCTWLKTT